LEIIQKTSAVTLFALETPVVAITTTEAADEEEEPEPAQAS
jgi:hypothetical protein